MTILLKDDEKELTPERRHELRYQVAVHEAGHAVIGHLTGTKIARVAIRKDCSGYSRPVRAPEMVPAKKLWKQARAINRKLRLTDIIDGKPVYVMREGVSDGRRVRSSRRLKDGTVRGAPASQELVDRMHDLRKRGDAIWKDYSIKKLDRDHRESEKDLFHAMGGPVADSVFFGEPFEGPDTRWLTKEELKANGLPETVHSRVRKITGNFGTGSDFESIRQILNRMGYDGDTDMKDAKQIYRHRVEQLVREHRSTIERVA